ncbi:hotdog family protein [Pararhizobium mangrovi]|uniref:dehydratase n=1 Tax=Pararhizobium mangrovi TaxID=2590452 RepID=UPI0038B24FE1
MDLESWFASGRRLRLGSRHFDEAEILSFARKYDPQRFDAEAARDTMFGGLCASGWHTTAAWMRANVDHWQARLAEARANGEAVPEFGPSPGFRELSWPRPVYAGETVTFHFAAIRSRALASRPGWHLMEHYGEGESEDGTLVMRFEGLFMVRP